MFCREFRGECLRYLPGGNQGDSLGGRFRQNLGGNIGGKIWSNLWGNLGGNLGGSLGGNHVDINLIFDLSS